MNVKLRYFIIFEGKPNVLESANAIETNQDKVVVYPDAMTFESGPMTLSNEELGKMFRKQSDSNGVWLSLSGPDDLSTLKVMTLTSTIGGQELTSPDKMTKNDALLGRLLKNKVKYFVRDFTKSFYAD